MKMHALLGATLLGFVGLVAAIDVRDVVQRWDDLGPLPPGEPLPDLTFSTLDGGEVETSALRGRVTVMTFWTTWCPACRSELADLDALAREFDTRDVGFVAVNLEGGQMPLQSAVELVDGYRKEHELELSLAVDAGAAARALRIGPIPHTLVVDADGSIRRVHQGRVLTRTLRSDIARIREEAPSPPSH